MKKHIFYLILAILSTFGAIRVSLGQDPCVSIASIDAGTTYSFSLVSGEGYLDADCSGSNEEGNEIIYEYTATSTGLHAIDITSNNWAVILALMYKESSGDCNSEGWECIDGWWTGTPSFYITLNAGTSYYIMFDRTNSTGSTSNISFQLIEPGTVDPCTTITDIPSCGTIMSLSLGNGLGFIDTQCFGGHEYGEEAIYSFTPTTTGMHALDVLTSNFGDVMLYAYKEASDGCISTGWNCLEETNWPRSYYINLEQDITYYFLFDKRRDNQVNSHNITFKITCPGTVDPCTVITDIPSCGTTMSLSLGNGLGFINSQCYGGEEYGEEAIYSFTPTMTGMHALDVLTSNYGDALLYAYKEASDGCNSDGWTCMGETSLLPNYYINLEQDITYYFLFDKRRDNPVYSHNITFQITCPGTLDPCTVITPITTCNEVYDVTLGTGLGFINTQCYGGNEYGKEAIFSFLATETGTFSLDMLSTNYSGPVLFAYKEASEGCNSSDWTCLGESSLTPSYSLSLTGSTEYYFLFDNRRDNPNSNPTFSFKISCPTTGDPCLDIITVTECGTSFNKSLTTGTGTLDPDCSGSNEQGTEQIFSYTPAYTGLHAIGITSNNNGDALSLSYKEASDGCNSSGMSCVDNGFTGTPEYFVTLDAGTEYYFLFDRLYNNTTNTETFTAKFICQGATDPCTAITALTISSTQTDTLRSNLGYLNVSCSGSDEEGEEKIYSFTPTLTGIYTIDFLSNNNADGMAILYKETGSGCDDTGWDCISNNFSGTGDLEVTLTEGLSYYFMFDREFTNQTDDEIYSFMLIPDNILLINNIIGFEQEECFLANSTITVAGDGDDYIVSDEGSLVLVAGEQILLKYGFHALPGSYLHAYIGSEGCIEPLNPVTITAREEKIVESLNYKDGSVLVNDQMTAKDYIQVYPNPTSGKLHIEIKSQSTPTIKTILVYDFLGNIIHVHESMSSEIIVLDLSAYPNGMYLVRIIDGKESETVKVVKYY